MNIEEALGDITPSQSSQKFDTVELFDKEASHPASSPVDQFIENSKRLSLLYLNEPVRSAYTRDVGVVMLLGHASAVESYLRALIRGLVTIDDHCRRLVEPLDVSYAAAIYHDKSMLPEALLEGVSFISGMNVSRTLKEFCGITGMGDSIPKELEPVFQTYDRICQLRHCCVHRFGRLGVKNAQRLGLDEHQELLEKPLNISIDSLEDISAALQRFVLAINSYVFRDVMRRTVENSPHCPQRKPQRYKSPWTLDFSDDNARFKRYYDLFSCADNSITHKPITEMYADFVKWIEFIQKFDSQKLMSKQKPSI